MPDARLLPAITIDTGPNPDASVIWMHGLGDTGHGWSQVVPELMLPRTLAARFLFPHAPSLPVTINQGYVMPAWYDIRAADLNARADLAGVRASRARIEAMIAAERARGVAASRIVLAGFSQGGVIALYTGLRHAERLAGLVGLSTYLVDPGSLGEASRAALEQAGWKVEWHAYPMEHEATHAEIRAVGEFLARVLAPKASG